MNKAILIGRLTADVSLTKTISQKSYASFTLAVNKDFKNKEGQYDADFIRCVAWETTADLLAAHTKKGHKLAVTGSITTRNYKDKNDQTVYVTEILVDRIEFLEPKEKSNSEKVADQVNSVLEEVKADDLPF